VVVGLNVQRIASRLDTGFASRYSALPGGRGLTRRCTRRGAVRWPGTEVACRFRNMHGVTAAASRSLRCYHQSRQRPRRSAVWRVKAPRG